MKANDLPLEIWQQVFGHACCDGGRTGLSLALTSRFFHNASNLVRFRSLAFSSLRNIQRFLDFCGARAITNHPKPKILHLLLSFSAPDHISEGPATELDTGAGTDAYVWLRVRHQREHEKAAWDRQFMVLVPSLLALAAPYLETLAMLQSDGHAVPVMGNFAAPMPRLRELTLLMGIAVMLNDRDLGGPGDTEHAAHGTNPPVARTPSPPPSPAAAAAGGRTQALDARPRDAPLRHPATAAPEAPPVRPAPEIASPAPPERCRTALWPALQRLHVVCGRHRDWTLRDSLACLPRLAPALTHIRISNATYTHGKDDCVPAFLRRALAPRVRAHTAWGRHDAGDSACGRGHEGGGGGAGEEGGAAAMPALKRVIVHSVAPPPGGRCDVPYENYRALVQSVRATAAACEGSDDIRVRLLESERARHRDWEEMIEAQWVDRVEGGFGCWDVFGDDG